MKKEKKKSNINVIKSLDPMTNEQKTEHAKNHMDATSKSQ